jgi:ABC-type sugar transport system ATPase subunit
MSAPSSGDQPLLRVRGLSKSFPGLKALDNVDLDVRAGEIVAVVGQNGSGKSTLVKVLTGIHEPDQGAEIAVRGAGARGSGWDSGIHVIHQDLGLVGDLSTVENLGLGRGGGRGGLFPTRRRSEERHARELMARFGVEIDVHAPIIHLSPAERTIVAIARALDGWERPDQLLLLDEPTASLHSSEVGRLFDAVRRVASAGAGVIFISHRLDEVINLADRVVALRDGRKVADVSSSEVDRERLVELIVGRALPAASAVSKPRVGEVVLSIRGLCAPSIASLDLDVCAGEVVGLCGILGSGREDIAGLTFGASERHAGTVSVNGNHVNPGNPRHSIATGVALVPRDRHSDGAVMTLSARENLTLPRLGPLTRLFGWIDGRTERDDVGSWIERIGLVPADPERPVELFSGGNQQKIVLAKWLRNEPTVLLLDEPTQGVDVGAKAAIYGLIAEAASRGVAVVLSSSDTDELATVCNRVVVLRDGSVTIELEGDALSESQLVAASLGFSNSDKPQIVEGANRASL